MRDFIKNGPSASCWYIEVADVEGGIYRPDPDNREMFIQEQLAEFAAEGALNRFPVVRICMERMTFRRRPVEV